MLSSSALRCGLRAAFLPRTVSPGARDGSKYKTKLKDKSVAALADYPGLENSLREILISADKNLRIYELTPAEAALLRKTIVGLKVGSGGVFSKSFPYPLSGSALASLQPQTSEIVAKVSGKQSTGLLFSSVHIVEVRELLTAQQLGAKANDYDQVIGIKKIKYQTFDVLLMSNTKDFAYVLTDATLDTTQSTRGALHSEIVEITKKLTGSNLLHSPVNLLPHIKPIYNSNEGLVKRLHYTTTTASGKQEWMRGNDNDLRQELSHKAGMTALSKGFQGYAIRVEYPLPQVGAYTPRPSLEINGAYRLTYELNPRVEDALLSDCATLDEVETTLAELMEHISGTKSV